MSSLDAVDIDDLRPSSLKRLLKQALLKEHKDKAKDSANDEADKDREDLADLHGEKKGDSKPPKVKSDDLPEELRKIAGDKEPDEDDEDESPMKKGKKKSPFGKKKKSPFGKKKKSFPFQKKG